MASIQFDVYSSQLVAVVEIYYSQLYTEEKVPLE